MDEVAKGKQNYKKYLIVFLVIVGVLSFFLYKQINERVTKQNDEKYLAEQKTYNYNIDGIAIADYPCKPTKNDSLASQNGFIFVKHNCFENTRKYFTISEASIEYRQYPNEDEYTNAFKYICAGREVTEESKATILGGRNVLIETCKLVADRSSEGGNNISIQTHVIDTKNFRRFIITSDNSTNYTMAEQALMDKHKAFVSSFRLL